jgi:hypothetical protein
MDDEKLLAALREALPRAGSPPCEFVEAGKAAFAWHNVDAELAVLSHDSAVDTDRRLAAVRAETAPIRSLTLASTRLRIELEVTRLALQGQLVPTQPGEIELRPAEGAPTTIVVDEVGWFVIQPVPVGSFRLRCQTADGLSVLTDWITL